MEMIILIGLQASGKTTYFLTHFATTHEYISMDRLRNNNRPRQRQAQLIAEALQALRSVVIDNTNATPAEREPLIQLGHAYGARVTGYYFESQVSQSIKHNRQRTGKARVPDVAIYATAKKLVKPSYAEGFDELFAVRATGDETFEVHMWEED